MNDFTIVDLLRHGEPDGGQKFRGAVDDPLSPRGWEQMQTAVGTYQDWEAIISSPLIRCAAFAQTLAQRLDRPLEIAHGFSEIRFGVWEGRSVAEVHDEDPAALGRFWRDPVAHPIPDGEPVGAFDQRIGVAWDALLERYRGRHVLLVAHGGVIRMILRRLLDMPIHRIWRMEVPFAAVSRMRVHRDPDAEPHLVFHNGRLA
ncbi:MAG TPA: histidine phosphatase family protein [Candidatus Competibacteraceae bacterium]|nr:MAG: histidine phosphatase family protein [Candidatus Competibacteraceae bacterium]HOB60903.1 histidine phosphatase family protein [Candidatus Competibacteraceae bacterium]HQA26882.1 histidine phosphatase family protein [Candidatus Competibacteraceae bacterium]HQD55083.1 histidine phosphatase family protein [Candidatus Competibacteraceae bacterium]